MPCWRTPYDDMAWRLFAKGIVGRHDGKSSDFWAVFAEPIPILNRSACLPLFLSVTNQK